MSHAFRLFLLFFNHHHIRIKLSFQHLFDYQAIKKRKREKETEKEKEKEKEKKRKKKGNNKIYTKVPYVLLMGILRELLDAGAMIGGFKVLMILPTCCT